MTLPDWPRSMKLEQAAAYCSLAKATFLAEVTRGKLPASFTLGGHPHWDRRALDAAIDRLAGRIDSDAPDYRRDLEKRYG